MTKEEWDNLRPGDIIRHINSSSAMIVTVTVLNGKDTQHVVQRTQLISNPNEWKWVVKADFQHLE